MDKKYRAIIVDDEELARRDLKTLLLKFPSIEVVGEASSVATAIEAIERHTPDVIFLDIQFPRETGFDLLEQIEVTAKIIFVTAYDTYAIRAFDVNAQDYLVKPVNPKRLAQAIERLEGSAEIEENVLPAYTIDDSVLLDQNNKLYFVKINTIVRITSADMYTEVVTAKGQKFLTNKSLKEWEQRLPVSTFLRIHRSILINMEFVEKIERYSNYSYRVFIHGFDTPVPISRRYISRIHRKMS